MATLRLQTQLWNNENSLLESLNNEAIHIYGDDFLYLPREYVAKDKVVGEDRLSKYTNAYPIVMYLKTNTGYEGGGQIMSKFGLQFDEQATLVVSKETWKSLVGSKDTSLISERPAEGDLIYWPRTNSIFEVMYTFHENPFYQLGKFYAYELTVEKFRYSGETIQTGIPCIDDLVAEYQVKVLPGNIKQDVGKPFNFGDNKELHQRAQQFVFDQNNPFGDL